jgi:hypothetical protein
MQVSEKLLEYSGPIDYKTIDLLLKRLKKTREYINLDKTTGKRVYAILVECLENIAKHSARVTALNPKMKPSVSINKNNGKVIIKAGNLITIDKTGELIRRLNQVNYLDDKALNILFENKINKETKQEDSGAGLGFMLLKLKSGNKIEYNFTKQDNDNTYFEIKISVNEHIMRKLIIDQTSNSPKVILDPEKNRFEISGESRPPDVSFFYGEILNWLDDYSLHLSKSSEIIER